MSSDLTNSRLLSVVLVVASLALFVKVILPQEQAGELLLRNASSSIQGAEWSEAQALLEESKLRLEVVKLTLEGYRDLAQLLTASFAVVSFLVGYQSKNRLELPKQAWFRLSVGVFLLGVALLLTLMGQEKLLTMLARDAMALGSEALLYLRWGSYTAFCVAAVFVSTFAVSAATAKPAGPQPLTPFEDD